MSQSLVSASRMPIVLGLVSALALACGLVTASTNSAPEAEAPQTASATVGVHQDIHFDVDKIPSMVSTLRNIGMRWVRFQILWENIQPNGPDSFNWAQYDRTFALLRNSGIKPIGVLNGAPAWARAMGCVGESCPPSDPAQFARFASAVAQHYQGQIAALEVWNEPNIRYAWAPVPDSAAYVRLLRPTYAAIKKADPKIIVVSAGLSPAGYEEGVSFDPVGYLDGMYRAGGAGSFDAVGWHPYGDPLSFGSYDPHSAWSQLFETPVSARSLMIANGDEDKQIWATEFGVSTSPGSYSEKIQADTLSSAVRLWKTYPFAGPLIVFNYRDAALNPTDRQQSYGVVHSNDAPKPAVFALKNAIGSR